MTQPTPAEALLIEMIGAVEEMVTFTQERIEEPPRGSIEETGHYRALNGVKLNGKQRDALRQVMEEVAFNVAVAVLAALDNAVETEIEVPKVSVTDQATGKPLSSGPLHEEFIRLWNEGADQQVEVED